MNSAESLGKLDMIRRWKRIDWFVSIHQYCLRKCVKSAGGCIKFTDALFYLAAFKSNFEARKEIWPVFLCCEVCFYDSSEVVWIVLQALAKSFSRCLQKNIYKELYELCEWE